MQSAVVLLESTGGAPARRFVHRAAGAAAAHPQLCCYAPHTPGRAAVESYIAATFRAQYGARVDHFLPLLLTLEDGGAIVAAVGIRFADGAPLFVEHYLDRPLLVELAQRGIAHRAVVEIGNLVSTRPGSSQLLFVLLANLLHALGCDTGVFTATAQVRRLLARIECPLQPLCVADGRRLGADLQHWGTYYAADPEVIAAGVAITLQHLQQRTALAATFARYADSIAAIAARMRPLMAAAPAPGSAR